MCKKMFAPRYIQRQSRDVKRTIPSSMLFLLLLPVILVFGCASVDPSYASSSLNATEIVSQYPESREPLKLVDITKARYTDIPVSENSNDVLVIVHPAYSVFFRDKDKEHYTNAKYNLLKKQFDNEAVLISSQAALGRTVVLVIPGNYPADSRAPLSYVSYLNSISSGEKQIYYVLSETSGSGTLAMNDMVSLYGFLQSQKVNKVMIGGGYIGRCQREFHNQLTTYMDKTVAYIVPELSTISPDDVSEGEAMNIFNGLQRQDYSLVKAFIDKKTGGKANTLSISQKTKL